jgi:hypothetical protein
MLLVQLDLRKSLPTDLAYRLERVSAGALATVDEEGCLSGSRWRKSCKPSYHLDVGPAAAGKCSEAKKSVGSRSQSGSSQQQHLRNEGLVPHALVEKPARGLAHSDVYRARALALRSGQAVGNPEWR